MAEPSNVHRQEPRGFGEHSRRRSSENAHEQGWGLNEDERRKQSQGKQNLEGGGDHDYGARDFGDTRVETSKARPSARAGKSTAKSREGNA